MLRKLFFMLEEDLKYRKIHKEGLPISKRNLKMITEIFLTIDTIQCNIEKCLTHRINIKQRGFIQRQYAGLQNRSREFESLIPC